MPNSPSIWCRNFESKPTERLIGEEIEPGHLHDETLGRALADLYDYGAGELFQDLATHAANQLDLTSRFAHSGATSFSFHAEYESEEESASEVISVQKGYSTGWCPDLNQVNLDLMVEHQAGLPIRPFWVSLILKSPLVSARVVPAAEGKGKLRPALGAS